MPTGSSLLRATILIGALTVTASVAAPAISAAATAPPRFDHIVVVMEENHSFSDVIGSSSAPYINSLASQGALFTNSFAIEHPSQPNYLDLFSGSNQGVTSDGCPHSFSANNVGNELRSAGLSFDSYSESLPSDGSTVCTSGNYARKHNPSSNFTDLPSSTNLRFSDFPSPANFANLPTMSMVDPNLQDDMHDGTIQQGDSWLQTNMDAYAQWAKTHNSLLVVTWDEDDGSASNQIPTLFVGANVTPGSYSEQINHFSVLRTIEDAYGIGHLGSSASATPITDVFTSSGGTGNTVTVTNPGAQTTTVGTASSLQLTATDSASGQALTYGATGLPAGLSVNAGSGLISGTPTAAGSSTVTVTATDSTGASGSTSFTWTVNPAAGGCAAPGQLLANPGFESGTTGWTSSSGVIGQWASSGEAPHSGNGNAWLDGYGTTHTDTVSQSVTIPSGCTATVSFYLHVDTAETTTSAKNDTLTVQLGSTTLATFSNLDAAGGYTQHTYDASAFAGQTATLTFTGSENSSQQTSFVLDDTAVSTN